jgi:hypothetical protein
MRAASLGQAQKEQKETEKERETTQRTPEHRTLFFIIAIIRRFQTARLPQ